jgi:hypothetical protein
MHEHSDPTGGRAGIPARLGLPLVDAKRQGVGPAVWRLGSTIPA